MTATTHAPEQQIAQQIARDTAQHQLTVLHDDGLYRHLRCAKPGSSAHWFEIVTWPGALTIRGDLDQAYTFGRIPDMFEFFRRPDGGINAHYWAEKLPDHGRSVRAYSEDRLRERLDEVLAEYTEQYADEKAAYDALPASQKWPFGPREPVAPPSPQSYREQIAEYDADGLLAIEEHARVLLRQMESDGIVSDTWEWDLSDWDWQYLWACHAIVWAIAQYDGRATAAETVHAGGETR